MFPLSHKTEFAKLTLDQKICVFDGHIPNALIKLDNNEILYILKHTILDDTENSYIRLKAVSSLTNHVLLKKIRIRQALNVIIDEWKTGNDVFLEAQRLKDLFYYYGAAENEIEDIYHESAKHDELEIASEANYRLGLIVFQKFLQSHAPESILDELEKCLSYLSLAYSKIENRDDSYFFLKVVSIIKSAFVESWELVDHDINDLSNLLFQWEIKSFNTQRHVFLISIYRSLNEFISIRSSYPAAWLDVREKLIALCANFYELQNQILKDRLNESSLSNLFVELIKTQFIEPYFAMNLQADIIRIQARLKEVDETTEEGQFLIYLKNIISDKTFKKKVEFRSLKESLRNFFSFRSEASIESVLAKIHDPADPMQIVDAYYMLAKPTLQHFVDSLIQACIYLQGNRLYRSNFSEDDRNTFIADMLTASGSLVKDQTRWSVSPREKSAGEIDIYISDQRGLPYAIIEALNLDYLNQNYLASHIDKLFKYDTAGHEANFILVYSTVGNFGEFWNKYINFIKIHPYKNDFISFRSLDSYKFTNLKIAETTHLRNGTQILLYHIVLDMS